MTRKSVLITGCSSGIGQASAHLLHRRGWQVFPACRKAEDCAKWEAQGFVSPRIDYEDTKSIAHGLQQVLDKTGGTLDALFNNGAYAIPGPVEDLPTDALRAIFEANFFGWHDLTRRVIPVMRDQGSGHIVQCSSVLGLVSMPMRGAYNATKYAVEGLTDAMRIELKDTGIKVVLIEPGPITTEFRRNAMRQFERWIDWKNSLRAPEYEARLLNKLYTGSKNTPGELPADAVAEKLWSALEDQTPRARYFVTTPTYVMAFLRRVLPTSLLDKVLAKG